MTHAKVFTSDTSGVSVEDQANRWLEGRDIEVVAYGQSESVVGAARYITISILYRDPDNDPVGARRRPPRPSRTGRATREVP